MKIFIGKENCCSLNYQQNVIYDEIFENFEITDKVEEADNIIIAETCCCTEYNMLKTLDYISSIIEKKRESTKIYLTGCITRKFKNDPCLEKAEQWLKENVDYIVPQNNPNLLLKLISQDKYRDIDINEFGMVDVYNKDSANIYIANGCLSNCSFCKITFQKYPLKSVDLNELKEVIDELNDNQISRIRLIATNVCQYGLDIYHEYMLPEIIGYLEKKENIKTVSLVGFSFKDAIKNNFVEILRSSQKVTRLSGSLETGSNRLLAMIRKGYTAEEIIDFVAKIRQIHYKDLILNIIAGFPTETLEDVHSTLDVLKQLDPFIVEVCRYTNSSFVDSNQFGQLTPAEIQNHTRVYSKVLKKRNVQVNIIGEGYKYN